MKEWLAETHGTGFELLRHFVRRFFDSELVTEPGQWAGVIIGSFSLLLTVFTVMVPSLMEKYRILAHTTTPDLYRHFQRADELWLLTLGMSAIGLLGAAKWQSLFPGRRDYLALGMLPVRAYQIFIAKFLALLLIVTAVFVTFNIGPILTFPVISAGPWRFNPSLAATSGRRARPVSWRHTSSCSH